MDSPFDGGFLAGASPFPRSDYPRSGRGFSVEWPRRCKIRNPGIDWQIYSVGFITSTERFRYGHQRNKNDRLRLYGDSTNASGTAGVYACLLLQAGLYSGPLRCCGWSVETKIHYLAYGQSFQDSGGQCPGLSAQGRSGHGDGIFGDGGVDQRWPTAQQSGFGGGWHRSRPSPGAGYLHQDPIGYCAY